MAYGDSIILYSVPPDVLELSYMEQKGNSWDIYAAPPFSSQGRAANHWLNWWSEAFSTYRWGSNPIWPVAIRGTEVGTLRGVCDLAIQTLPDITIWGFTLDSRCKTWRLRNHADPVTRSHRYVCKNGVVHDAYAVDEAGDVIMIDADIAPSPTLYPSPTSPSLTSEHELENLGGLDGYSSQIMVQEDVGLQNMAKRLPRALNVENDEWVDFLDVRGCNAWYEENGDVVMVPWDVHTPETTVGARSESLMGTDGEGNTCM